jgi:hypothetical protein
MMRFASLKCSSLLAVLALGACATKQDPWPDAQDQMAGFALIASPQARRPGSTQNSAAASCFDSKTASGLAPTATLELELSHADVAYAAEDGSKVEIGLDGSLRSFSQVDAKAEGGFARNGAMVDSLGSSDTVVIDTYQTVSMPRTIDLRLSGLALNELLEKTPYPKHAELVVSVQRKGQGRPQNLGRLVLSVGDLRATLEKNATGFKAEEKIPLKYRGLASIRNSVSCE